MSATIHGEIPFPFQVQPERTIVERTDGTLEGTVDYVTTQEWAEYLPQLEQTHPDDRRLEIHTVERTVSVRGLMTCTAHFRGIKDDPTDTVISYIGSPDRESIETHPQFSTLAGTDKATAKNGAEWVSREGYAKQSFVGFNDPNNDLFGVQYYLKASTQITTTHWQTKVPRVERMRIVDSIAGFKKPTDVKNFLLIDTPYRQIGNLYQVSKIYLGSDVTGWNESVYPQAT